MKIRFLGTGAADYPQALYDEKEKYLTDNRSLRRSSMTLINDDLLIDCGEFADNSFFAFNVDLQKIKDVFFTHSHEDHFNLKNLRLLVKQNGGAVRVWCKEGFDLPKIENMEVHYLKHGDIIKTNGYEVTALNANHSAFPLHYSIEKDGKKIFYGLDGAWFLYDTYYFMMNKHYDAVILDCTVGDYEGDYRMAEHNSIPMLRLMIKSFFNIGIIDDKTKIVFDHIATTLNDSYEVMQNNLKEEKIIVAYDGMSLD